MSKTEYINELNEHSAYFGTKNGLTPKQIETLEFVAYTRHKLHTYKNPFFYDLDNNISNPEYYNLNYYTKLLNGLLEISGLPPIDFEYNKMYLTYSDCISIYGLERNNYYSYSLAKQSTFNEIERINSSIEIYLGCIDRKYETYYKPTGYARGHRKMTSRSYFESLKNIFVISKFYMIHKKIFFLSSFKKYFL